MKCFNCGRSLDQKKFGRPSTYCSDNCRDMRKYFDAFVRCLDRSELSAEAKSDWRKELFLLANTNL